jgi:cbb3-type cytochrome oxidase subunit 3
MVFLLGFAFAYGAHLAFGVGREGEVLIVALTVIGFFISAVGVVAFLEYRRAQRRSRDRSSSV